MTESIRQTKEYATIAGMKTLLLFGSSVFLGLLLVVFYAILPKTPAQPAQTNPQQVVQFSLERAPSQSMQGTILATGGSVFWQSRVATEPAVLTSPVRIQQGEKIETRESGTISVEFPNVSTIDVSEKSALSFVQTLPTSLVISQTRGTVRYTKPAGATPLAVRYKSLLIELTEGTIDVAITEKQPAVSITVHKGTATAAFNDSSEVSQLLTVASGRQLYFNDDTRRATILNVQ